MTKTTAAEIATQAYIAGPDEITKHTDHDGTIILTLGDRRFAIADEFEDDGETLLGYTWSTYAVAAEDDTLAPIGMAGWEQLTTASSPSADDAAAAIAEWMSK
jgi:hypothetical protein